MGKRPSRFFFVFFFASWWTFKGEPAPRAEIMACLLFGGGGLVDFNRCAWANRAFLLFGLLDFKGELWYIQSITADPKLHSKDLSPFSLQCMGKTAVLFSFG